MTIDDSCPGYGYPPIFCAKCKGYIYPEDAKILEKLQVAEITIADLSVRLEAWRKAKHIVKHYHTEQAKKYNFHEWLRRLISLGEI